MLTINLFRSTLNTQSETILIDEKEKAIKDCLDIDFEYAIISVNGFEADKNYILKDGDVCTIRQTHGLIATAFAVTEAVRAGINGRSFTEQVKEDVREVGRKIVDFISPDNIGASGDATPTNNVDTTTQSIPQLQGAKNQSGYGKPIPLVLGRSMFTPYYCGNMYRTVSGTDGEKQTLHVLYMLGYNNILVEDIKLGMTMLSSNPNNITDGVFSNADIDGRWDAEEYKIKLELRQTDREVGLYPAKVSEEQLNIELYHINANYKLELNRFSAKNPKTIQLEFTLNGLIEYTDKGEEKNKSVQIQLKISYDGGQTFVPFGEIEGASSYDSSTGISTITKKKNKVMRFVATKELSASDAYNLPNGVAELYICRVNEQATDSKIFDKVYLSGIRTWSFDPKLSSSSTLVAQAPLDPIRRKMTARLAFEVQADEVEFKGMIDALNCILTSKARTYSNGQWSSSTTATQNPASLALMLLQHPSRGKYAYLDSQIDLAMFGEFYEWCNQARSQNDNTAKFKCNGVITNKKKTQEYLDAILDCGRARYLYNNRKISLWIDKPRTISVMVLNNQNILSMVNNKVIDDLPDGFKTKFLNEITWQADEWKVDIVSPLPSDPMYQSIDLVFQTDAKQVYQNLRYIYAKMKLRPETWKVKVSVDGNLLDFGSLIEIQNDTLSVGIGDGAEIKALVYDDIDNPIYITQIVTDGNMYIDDLTAEYGIKVTCADGTNEPKVMHYKVDVSVVGEQHTFVLHTPILISSQYKPNVGDIVSFGFFDNETTMALCFGKKDNGDGTFDLTLVPYQEGIYTADSGEIPEFITNISNVPQRDAGNYKIDNSAEQIAEVNKKIADIEEGTVDTGDPDAPTGLTAKAEENGIKINWIPVTANGLKNTIKQYNVEISKDSGTNWTELGATFNSDYYYTFTRTGEGADGYPEASGFNTWRFRVKAINIYGYESEYVVTTNGIDVNDYGQWQIPQIRVDTEVVDRTVILTATYSGNNKVYGKIKTCVLVRRIGNTDLVGDSEHPTFNEMLGVNPDELNGEPIWYTPEFNKQVQPQEGYDYELNYRTNTQTAYESSANKITHTLPLIGQTARIFKEGNELVKVNNEPLYTKDVSDYVTVPDSQYWVEGLVIHYTGNDDSTTVTGFTFYKNGYYMYTSSHWIQVYSKSLIVPTSYQYEIYMMNEAGLTKASAPEVITVQALCTNIADIVHSHEHFKNLYVEKLSAINANIGLITQGGMGSFSDMLNYWALSDLSAEDSGVLGGVKKGAFRVGGRTEYFQVTPTGNDNYKIELRAGNIELTSDVSGDSTMDFTNGTYVYNDKRTARLWLTPSGIVAQKFVATLVTPVGNENPAQKKWYIYVDGSYILTTDTAVDPQQNYYIGEWIQTSKVVADDKGNMILSNSYDVPPFGYQVENAVIYHLEDSVHPEHEEVGNNETPSNPQSLSFSGDVEDVQPYAPILETTSSSKCFNGTVSKDISSWTGRVVFFTKSDEAIVSGKAIHPDGTVESVPAPLTGYNEAMQEESTPDSSKSLGEYLGLNETQIQTGIFN